MTGNPFLLDTTFPPSITGIPVLAMLTIMSFWALTLICLKWIYDAIDHARDNPVPEDSYLSVVRRVRFWLVMALLVLSTPRLLSVALWQVLSANMRSTVSTISWVVCIPAAAMVIYAWWHNRVSKKTEEVYIARAGYLMAQPRSKSERARGLLVIALITVVAFATTFVRPSHHVDAAYSVPERP